MKIYFCASLVGKEKYPDSFKRIIAILKKNDCDVFSDHVMKRNHVKVNQQNKAQHQKDYERMLKQIKDSDGLIIESTYPSIGVGNTLALALDRKKPTLVLTQGQPHGLLLGDPNEMLIVQEYKAGEWKDLEKKIEDFLSSF